ncbi:MAG TPA: hypothetical protein ENK40_00275 [Gammaproteobacteria bacterium]|nr:hypothetical protein [Gammaproteobacteria bacterium]
MKNRSIVLGILTALAAGSIASPVLAGGVTYRDGDKYLKIGGRIQFQYKKANPENGASTSDLYFRRLRPYIEGSLHKDWKGKFQWDMGKAEDTNEIALKDAYFAYKGFDNKHVIIGNYSFPFSREFLTSSKYQQFVERTFSGDHEYGTPDRQMGIHLTGKSSAKTLSWGASVARGAIDPDVDKLDFDTVANKNIDFNEGLMIGGRIDWHPLGYLKMSQGNFDRKNRITLGLAAFNWNNNDENNTYTSGGSSTSTSKADVSDVTAYEISAAYRGYGFSIDAEYNTFDANTVVSGFTGGIYTNGSTKLTNAELKGGYMFGQNLELVAGYQTQDADGYASAWKRTSIGANWFIHEHDVKFQLTYRMGKNLKGVTGNDEKETFLQAQYVF